MIHITLDQVQGAAALAVEEKGPEHVYDRGNLGGHGDCFYVHEDGPGCIVGNILHRLGVPLELMIADEGMKASALLTSLEYQGAIVCGFGVSNYLADLQNFQDHEVSWGDALRHVSNKSY